MKNYIFLILISLVIFSCDYNERYPQPVYDIQDKKIDYILELRDRTIDIIYCFDAYANGYIDYNQQSKRYNPEQIQVRKKGDCVEQATYFAWIVYQYLGIKPVFYRSGKIDYNGEYDTHIMCYIEDYNYWFNEWGDVIKSWNFDTHYYKIEYNESF